MKKVNCAGLRWFANECQKDVRRHQQVCTTTYKDLRPSGVDVIVVGSTPSPLPALTRISPYPFDAEGVGTSGIQPPVSLDMGMAIDPNAPNESSSPNPVVDTLGDELSGGDA